MGIIHLLGPNYTFTLNIGNCYCLHQYVIDKNMELELKNSKLKIITKESLEKIIKNIGHIQLKSYIYPYKIEINY